MSAILAAIDKPVLENSDPNPLVIDLAVDVRNNTRNVIDEVRSADPICMKKVVMVEEIVYDTEMRCEHVHYESCFQTYQSTFKPADVRNRDAVS